MNLSKSDKLILAGCVLLAVLLVALAFYSYYTTDEKTRIQKEQDEAFKNSGAQAAGFSVIRPVAWNFQGSGYGTGNTLYTTKATVAFSNIAGVDLTVAVNGTSSAKTSIVKFSKPGATYCGWFGPIEALDEMGSPIKVTWDSSNKYGTVALPAGKQMIINGLLSGPNGLKDTTYTCGGPSGGAYRWTIAYQTALDQYNIQHSDSGTITGKFQ